MKVKLRDDDMGSLLRICRKFERNHRTGHIELQAFEMFLTGRPHQPEVQTNIWIQDEQSRQLEQVRHAPVCGRLFQTAGPCFFGRDPCHRRGVPTATTN